MKFLLKTCTILLATGTGPALAGDPAVRTDHFRISDQVQVKDAPNFSTNITPGPFAPWNADVMLNTWAHAFTSGPIQFQHHGRADDGGEDWLQHNEAPRLSVWDQARSGFWDGADVYIYRIENGVMSLLRKTKVAKSSIGNDPATNARTEEKIWFEDKGPAVKPGDFYVLRMERDRMPMQIRKEILQGTESPLLTGYSTITGKADWSFDRAQVAPEGGSRASLKVDMKEATPENPSGPWHWFVTQGKTAHAGIVRFKEGKQYRAQVWLKQEGMSDPRVKLQFGTVKRATVDVTGEWQKFEFDLPVDNPELPYADSQNDGTRLWIAGVSPGTLWIDNFMVYQTDAPPFAVMREEVETLKKFKPHTLRLWGGLDAPTLEYWLSQGFAQPTTMSGYGKSGQPVLASLSDVLNVCQEVGADPWLIINPWFTAEENAGLMEYLAGPADQGLGQLRAKHGRAEPWTKAFKKIYIESANEAWNQIMRYAMPSQPERYAAVADRQFRELKTSPYFARDKFEFIANGWDNSMKPEGWTRRVALASKEADRVDIAYYFGGWEKNATAPEGDAAAMDEVFQDKLLGTALEFGPKVVDFSMADPQFVRHFAGVLGKNPDLLASGLASIGAPKTNFKPEQLTATDIDSLWALDTEFPESIRGLVASRRVALEFPLLHASFRAVANDPALQSQTVEALALAEPQILPELADGLIDLNAPSRLLPLFKAHPESVNKWVETLDGSARKDLEAFLAKPEKLTYNITNQLRARLQARVLELAAAGDPAFLAALRKEATPELIRGHMPNHINYVMAATLRHAPERRVDHLMQAMKADPVFASAAMKKISEDPGAFQAKGTAMAGLLSKDIVGLFGQGEAFKPEDDSKLLMRALPGDVRIELWQRVRDAGLPSISDENAKLLMAAMLAAQLGDTQPAEALATDPVFIENLERRVGDGIPVPFLTAAGNNAEIGDRLTRQLTLDPSLSAKKLAVYEGGPGYSLPGPGKSSSEEDENVGKSLALGTATLDASMQFIASGAAPVAYYKYRTGAYWSSHNNPKDRVPYPTWLALEMRNTLCPGDLLVVDAVDVHRIDVPDKEILKTTNDGKGSRAKVKGRQQVPMTVCYAFRDGENFSVMLLNRSLTEPANVTLDLPSGVSGGTQQFALTNPDPKANNREAQNVSVQESEGPELKSGMQVVVPPASVVVLSKKK
jgi:hypothetical protein